MFDGGESPTLSMITTNAVIHIEHITVPLTFSTLKPMIALYSFDWAIHRITRQMGHLTNILPSKFHTILEYLFVN